MAPLSRLERLKKLQAERTDDLPERPPTPPQPQSVANENTSPEKLVSTLTPIASGKGRTKDVKGSTPFIPKKSHPPPATTASSSEDDGPADTLSSSATPSRELRYLWYTAPQLPIVPPKRGELADVKENFCPILPISKFPYKYIPGQKDTDLVAHEFFDGGKFWFRQWDLYYVWHPDGGKPLILIRTEQVAKLLRQINDNFSHLSLSLDRPHFREVGLIITFPQHPTCRPRYLGRSSSKEDFTNMEANTPEASHKLAGEADPGKEEPESLAAFKRMIEAAQELNKAKRKATKAKNQEVRVVQQRMVGQQLKRAQRFLGLRPKNEQQDDSEAAVTAGLVPPIDNQLPVPYPFESSVVYISIDVESYERNHNLITEIGIATLDTNDLQGVPPGKDGENWREKIRARHFRIREYSHLQNAEFVQGCAGSFRFGKSEMIALADARHMIAECFREPFHELTIEEAAASWKLSEDEIKAQSQEEKRKIVLVGHDVNQDIQYLQKLGYNPLNLSNIVEPHDTAALYKSLRQEVQPRSLGSILADLDITGWFLHNAGNDAVYTMQVLLGICVRDASMRGTKEAVEEIQRRQEQRVKEKMDEARERALDDQKGWSDVEGDDGGPPLGRR
ncbi:hypothetical protein K402DRAFT_152266 [Aulographum hederae CBS 113979]|uniref:Gfd2/YDR514C-like C-terminal domain-containing protein n=1 Tax=Aulographum hederae CBS 113979 TaxID=1176131 RepID=A0A6G1GSZ6_9PEZI|nr:hypothetical protein K402DRAFT_152266 [Aulographum hederae CBS 113979]